jgi:hypothetical protein
MDEMHDFQGLNNPVIIPITSEKLLPSRKIFQFFSPILPSDICYDSSNKATNLNSKSHPAYTYYNTRAGRSSLHVLHVVWL